MIQFEIRIRFVISRNSWIPGDRRVHLSLYWHATHREMYQQQFVVDPCPDGNNNGSYGSAATAGAPDLFVIAVTRIQPIL